MKPDSLLPPFSHLYVEEELLEGPWVEEVRRIRDRLTKAVVVPIGSFEGV